MVGCKSQTLNRTENAIGFYFLQYFFQNLVIDLFVVAAINNQVVIKWYTVFFQGINIALHPDLTYRDALVHHQISNFMASRYPTGAR